jgi:hypothetical protein
MAIGNSCKFFLFTAMGAACWGQSTFGGFVGAVRDPSGGIVANSIVKVKNLGTDVTRDTLTDARGDYNVVNLEPGEYEISVEAPGFQPAKVSGITLLARQTIRQNVSLALATQAQTVNVSVAAEAPLNTEVSNIAETKVGRELVDLPVAIASRSSGSTSPFTTLTTQPGVQTDGTSISVAGAKPAMLSMSLDGISTVGPRSSGPLQELFPSFDTIAEIRVSEVNNTAEFGGVSDITTISKSGTNSFHGGAFENHQNAYLNARNIFAASKPALVENDFGGFLGGPVTAPKLYHGKDKTFFFMSYEGLRLPKGFVLTGTVPTAAMRAGDLSVYLPKTLVKDPLAGTPFPNNQIPLTRIDPLSLKALTYLFPLPNFGSGAGVPTNNLNENFGVPLSTNQGDMRVDHNITSKQSAFARLSYKRIESGVNPSGTGVFGTGFKIENDYSLSGTHNYIITPHLINELRAGLTGSNAGTGYAYTAAGVQQELGLLIAGPVPVGAVSPNFSVTGFTGTTGGTSSISRSSTVQLLDNVTWTRNKHTVKFGGDYRYLRALFTNVFATNRIGTYTFNNSATSSLIGSPFGAFLLGIPDRTGMATVTNPDTYGYANHYAVYGQDDWKITSRFTLNYGLRWEYHPMFNDHYNNVANWLPDYTGTINGVTVHGAAVVPDAAVPLINPDFVRTIAPSPVLTASEAGIPQSLRYSEKTDFAPRIGFAWRVTGDGKTIVRAGYGKFIEAELGSLILAGWAVEASDVGTFTNSVTGGKPLYKFPYPFPAVLAQPGTLNFDLAGDLHYKDPYVQQWNFTVERDLGFQTALRLTYDGSHGTDLGITENSNQVPANTVGFAIASKSAPFPQLAENTYLTNGARSNYNAFTVTMNKRMSKGLQFQVTYTFAKNLSNGGGSSPTSFASESGGTVSDPYNLNVDYGNVIYTRRNRFLATFLYNTPTWKGNRVLAQLTGGWELGGVLLFQDGPFLTVNGSGIDPGGTNASNLGGSQRVDVVSGAPLYPANQSPAGWMNSSAFYVPPNNIGRIGTEPIGFVQGPGTQAVSLSFFRSFNVTERIKLRMGISAANAFNHPNYGTPGLTLGTSTFGIINTLQTAEGAGPRQVQLTGRITF